MNAVAGSGTLTYARTGSRSGAVHVDTVTLSLVLGILLLGLVMVTSASIYMASNQGGEAFAYLQRQLMLTLIGATGAAFMFCIPTRMLERVSMPLLIIAFVLLFLVLVPGVGHVPIGLEALRVAHVEVRDPIALRHRVLPTAPSPLRSRRRSIAPRPSGRRLPRSAFPPPDSPHRQRSPWPAS